MGLILTVWQVRQPGFLSGGSVLLALHSNTSMGFVLVQCLDVSRGVFDDHCGEIGFPFDQFRRRVHLNLCLAIRNKGAPNRKFEFAMVLGVENRVFEFNGSQKGLAFTAQKSCCGIRQLHE